MNQGENIATRLTMNLREIKQVIAGPRYVWNVCEACT